MLVRYSPGQIGGFADLNDGTCYLGRWYLHRGGLQVAPRAGAILSEKRVLSEGLVSVVKSSLNGGLRMRKCLKCKHLWRNNMK